MNMINTDPPPVPTAVPCWLGNGVYDAVLTPTGTGFSMYDGYLLSAWADDPCEDEYGVTLYLRDLATGSAWSACGAPLPGTAARQVTASADAVTIDSVHGSIAACVRVEVLALAGAERRRLTLTNRGAQARELELTGYVEVVLNSAAAQDGHPAFSKLFVQTRYRPAAQLLIATRRPRANAERHPALGLALLGGGVLGYETDRVRFVGRGRTVREPLALTQPLAGTLGNVLDPVLALRTRVALAPGESRTLSYVLVAAADVDGLEAALAAATGEAALAPALPLDGSSACVPERLGTLLQATRGAARVGYQIPPATATLPLAAQTQAHPGNGFGEFVDGGRSYRIRLAADASGRLRLPPMPWSNVIANESFGLIASEKGSLSSFAGNSRLHRLTPWRNDPVTDPHDEALYLRDQASGAYWSLLPGPAPAGAEYELLHGQGWSSWRHEAQGLHHEVTLFVPRHDPLRIALVRLTNRGPAERSLALYSYQRWVLGGTPAESRATLAVAVDVGRAAVLAHNTAAGPFAHRIAFAAFAGGGPVDATADRESFLGRPGSLSAPRALLDGGPLLAQAEGGGCAALRTRLNVPAGGEVVVAVLLGEADAVEAIDALLYRYRQTGAAEAALVEVRDWWRRTLSATQVSTPAPEIDLMVNGWLGYQTLVCRLWARSAYYQSGGAYGFRDQLQDAAALAQTLPELLRAQLLENAAHQFVEGDVLHWWHTPASEGIRTRFADDLVWLPWLAAHYVRVTGDKALLEVRVPFVGGPVLDDGENERYFVAQRVATEATVYGHCVLALERAMTRGAHGLPLFGAGDWNDGMNRVGHEGRGESVWMAFFLHAAIGDFLPHVIARGDSALVARLRAYREAMALAANDAGWDGGWYRRGYYDNGTPLGSQASDECRIDALAQAWAVISGVAPAARQQLALDALEAHLVSTEDRLIRLLTPPFEHTPEDPGYIKGYVAGVRENGGQYTHAALWVVRALAEAGRRERAVELLRMLSPVAHTGSAADVERYKVEPYVVAADVYGVAPHVGRGGWTWYTGSAGWMLRVALESVLGLGIEAGRELILAPRVPDAWPGFELDHRRPDGTSYRISVGNPTRCAETVVAARLDGVPLAVRDGVLRLPLAADGASHQVEVTLGASLRV